MRHKSRDKRLGRSSAHLKAMQASLVCNLIAEKRIKTTLIKAKLVRRLAEKMVTLGRQGTLAARRRAAGILPRKKQVAELFDGLAPQFGARQGGYTRIVKLGRRASDGAEMAVLEWVDIPIPNKKKKKKEKSEKPEKAVAAAAA